MMLLTPQVRAAAVKRVYPRAHIEIARDRKALEKYVTKEDTRVAVIECNNIPSIFEYQTIIAKRWTEEGYEELRTQFPRKDPDDVAMFYLDSLVSEDIRTGQRGAEWIATNPMWRNAWKKFWRSIIEREHATPPPFPSEAPCQEAGDGTSSSSDLQQVANLHGDSGN